MAKGQLVAVPTKTKTRTKLVQAAKSGVRRAGSAIAARARDEKHTMTALLAAFAAGYCDKNNVNIPTFGPLSKAGTAGVLAFAIAKMTKNKTAEHVATGLLSVQAYQFAAGAAVVGDDIVGEEVSGEV